MFSKNNNAQTIWVGLSFLVVGLMAGLLVANSEELLENSKGDGDSQEEDFDVNALEVVDVSVDDDAVLGDPDAPVTIVEFSDFQCPYCRSFFKETLPQLISDYVDTGKVKIVYRDFALSGHRQASLAAQAAECVRSVSDTAPDDIAYFDFHDWLFENMATWSGQDTASELFITAAQDELGLDIRTCLENGEMEDEVNADMLAGRGYGVTGTPSFFINGKMIVGAYPYEIFQAVIESEL